MSTTTVFRRLHGHGLFVMPNAWDIGSARLLEHLGFKAIATTSSGLAASLGRLDQSVSRDELLAHVESLTAAVSVPVSVDAEMCYPASPGGITRTVDLIAGTGAAGLSIEDYDPETGILPLDLAVERVREAVGAAVRHGLVVTARAENHLYGVNDLDDTTTRLQAYRDAGADVVYAPALTEAADIEALVNGVGAPANVLALPGVPPVPELEKLGVRRVSTGGALAWAAYGALARAGREILRNGTTSYFDAALPPADRDAFTPQRNH
ncbi:MAG TPA: isocitrate lyase/phosphoenolpyruvate mutase family protein [Jiangellaceae bacterium]